MWGPGRAEATGQGPPSLVARQQTAHDTDNAAKEQETYCKQQERVTHDSRRNVANKTERRSRDSFNICQQAGHGRSSTSAKDLPSISDMAKYLHDLAKKPQGQNARQEDRTSVKVKNLRHCIKDKTGNPV